MMEDLGRNDIVNLHRYARPGSFKYYKLDDVEDVCYLPLIENTKYLPVFKLFKYQHGIVIVMPRWRKNKGGELEFYLPEFVDQPQLFKTFHEYKDWSLILKVRTVGQLNRYIMDDEIGDVIRVAEALQEKKIVQIADQIARRPDRPKFIFISGPSSSGKTTFAKRLGTQLMVNGMRPIAIGLDNYFVERERTPRDENGDYDFESLDAIDVDYFNQQLNELLAGKEVGIPRFDFRTGSRRGVAQRIKLKPEHIIVIEGIHALNPKLTKDIDRKHKFLIYISALTQLNLHRHDRIATSDSRLIRRIVRDSYFRGYSASETIARWPSVRKGEDKNIFPLQENADAMFNSALFYELSVLKGHAERALLKVGRDDPGHVEAQRLLKFLSYFVPIDSSDVPNSSLLREFVGGSTFDY
jgi:uridine kinase